MLTIYKYDEQNVFCGESVTVLDPEESKKQGREVWLMPPNATSVKPTQKKGYAPVWNGSAWKQVADHRGKTGWIGREPVEIKELGPLPDGFSANPPAPTPEEAAGMRRAEIQAELARIDAASARPLRAILAAQAVGNAPNVVDSETLARLEEQAQALRKELGAL